MWSMGLKSEHVMCGVVEESSVAQVRHARLRSRNLPGLGIPIVVALVERLCMQ